MNKDFNEANRGTGALERHLTLELAGDYMVKIGDTPEVAEDGRVIVREGMMQGPDHRSADHVTTAVAEFDFLVPYRKLLLRPDEAAKSLGRTLRFVYQMIDEGRLEAHAPQGRKVKRYAITRRSVLALLAETTNYRPADAQRRLLDVLESFNVEQLDHFLANVTRLRARAAAKSQ